MPRQDLDSPTWLGAVSRALDPLRRVAAHDVRSPLNALRLNLTLVRRTLPAGTAERWLGVAEEEVGKLEACIASLGVFLGPVEMASPAKDLTAAVVSAQPLLRSLATRLKVQWMQADGKAEIHALAGRWPAGAPIALLAIVTSALAGADEGDALDLECRQTETGNAVVRIDGAQLESEAVERLWPPASRVMVRAEPAAGALEIQVEPAA